MPGVPLGAFRGETCLPEEWLAVGRVEKLYLYPVKSLAHVQVGSISIDAFAGRSGKMTDRTFLVTDSKGKVLTSRRYPKMSLIQPQFENEMLVLKYPGQHDISVAVSCTGETRTMDIWGDSCQGLDMGNEVGKWLSDVILGTPDVGLRLVYHPTGESSRPDKEDNQYLTPLSKAGDKPYFADGYPYYLLTSPSVIQLNYKLKEAGETLEVEETRFRPNIFVSGEFPAFAEDSWSYIKIGDAVFRNVKPCSRCVFTTVDPAKGEKDERGQPLKILREFRSTDDPVEKKHYGTSPFFGINLGVESTGTISVGQEIQIRKSEAEKILGN